MYCSVHKIFLYRFYEKGKRFWRVGLFTARNEEVQDMLLWLAGLETIPRPLYEAAAVDGATPFQTFVFITLPNLLPTVVLTTILSLVNSFKVFREAYLVAGNYPQESIYLLQHLFNNWFLSLDIGKLSAAAVLLALGLGCVVYLLYHFWGGGQE